MVSSTMVSSTWALSLLLNNKEDFKKAQQEFGSEIGRDRQVKEKGLKNLPYIQAIIKETLRLYPAGPLSVPHESTEDCTINGYHVTKIQMNASVWEDPDVFRPERFLTTHKDFDLRDKNFELIPFGGGRRICPGISMSLQVLGLSLGSSLHGFEFTTPGNEPVDITEAIDLTNLKATTYKKKPQSHPTSSASKPCLPDHLYNV